MAVLGAGGGTSANIQSIAFTGSTTWSPMFDCKALVYVIGGGGAGASNYLYQANTYQQCGSGGAAGGCATSLLDLKSAHTYTLTIGAGGVAVAKTYNTGAAGGAGGNTTFADGSGTISTMTGNGGGGGNFQVNQSANTSAAAATGGSASGGTLANVTGGASGAATKPYTSSSYGFVCTGGGSVGINGVGFSSGAAESSGYTAGNPMITSGAGVGGSSGSMSGFNYGSTSGGSANGPSANGASTVTLVSGVAGIGDGFSPANALSLGGSSGDTNVANGQGSNDTGYIAIAEPGAGGTASYEPGYSPWVAQAGGVFAGGGAMAMGNQSLSVASAGGAGGLGAGGGAGGRRNNSNYGTSSGGAGGSGVIIIQILEQN
tara:strand:- start:2254 stop:3375 length:1122 start_codon:yes stop_codon:yes gene_type:complete